jgi:exonuclease SbcD
VAPGRDSANSVSVYEGLKFDGVAVARRLEVYRYTTTHGACAVIAVPWLMREIFVSNHDDLRMVGLAEQEHEMVKLVESYIQTQVDILMAEDANRPIIVTYHGTVAGAVSGFERQLTLGRDIQMPQSVLCPAGVDYVALGHVHKHQVLRSDPPMVYAGSIERIDFGEINETKGCVLVKFHMKQASYEFIPLAARPFVEIAVDVQQIGDSSVMDRIQLAIERKDVKNAVVKVVIDALPAQRALISDRQIRVWLEGLGAAYVARITVVLPRQIATPDGVQRVNTDGLPTPIEALEEYLVRHGISESERAALLALGREIMGGSAQ